MFHFKVKYLFQQFYIRVNSLDKCVLEMETFYIILNDTGFRPVLYLRPGRSPVSPGQPSPLIGLGTGARSLPLVVDLDTDGDGESS